MPVAQPMFLAKGSEIEAEVDSSIYKARITKGIEQELQSHCEEYGIPHATSWNWETFRISKKEDSLP